MNKWQGLPALFVAVLSLMVVPELPVLFVAVANIFRKLAVLLVAVLATHCGTNWRGCGQERASGTCVLLVPPVVLDCKTLLFFSSFNNFDKQVGQHTVIFNNFDIFDISRTIKCFVLALVLVIVRHQ